MQGNVYRVIGITQDIKLQCSYISMKYISYVDIQ